MCYKRLSAFMVFLPAGWQYLFIIEGVPSVLLGLAIMVWLPSTPLTAWMLSPEERELLHRKAGGCVMIDTAVMFTCGKGRLSTACFSAAQRGRWRCCIGNAGTAS
jgi:hypothetical protein